MTPRWSLLQALPEAVLVAVEGRVHWLNAAAEALIGVKGAEALGTPLAQHFAPGELARLLVLESQRSAGWAVPEGLRLRLLRDGQEVRADVRVAVTETEWVLTARDVSDRLAAERLLSKLAELSSKAERILGLEALLESAAYIFEQLGWVVALTEVKGNAARVTHLVGATRDNPLAAYGLSILGVEAPLASYPVITALLQGGRPLFFDDAPARSTGPEHDARALSASMDLARGRTQSAWVRIPHEPGEVQVLSVAGASLNEDDFAAIQLFAAQLAAARRLEQLRAAMVRRERLAVVGELSAVLAHEVRNPLAVLLNTVNVLRRVVDPSQQAALLDVASAEIGRLQQLSRELLEYSRPVELHLEKVPVGEVITEAISAARQDPGCDRQDFRIGVQASAELPPARADRVLLRRALVNVISNAIQHVSPGGQIRIAAEPTAPNRLRIHIANDGSPVPPGMQALIFEPFFTTREGGTGLGLAVVKQILSDMDGEISVEPATSGAVFAMELPAEAEPS